MIHNYFLLLSSFLCIVLLCVEQISLQDKYGFINLDFTLIEPKKERIRTDKYIEEQIIIHITDITGQAIFVSPAKHSGTQGSLCLASVCPSVRLCVSLSGSHAFLVVAHSYVSQATHAFLGMLPLCFCYGSIVFVNTRFTQIQTQPKYSLDTSIYRISIQNVNL